MRFIGIDYGDVRTGFAVGDDITGLSSPLEVVSLKRNDLISYILKLILKYEPNALVVGLPLNMDGTEGLQAKKVQNFLDDLKKKTNIQVFLQDERLTSDSAKSKLINRGLTNRAKKARRDALAACEFLNDFITCRIRK